MIEGRGHNLNAPYRNERVLYSRAGEDYEAQDRADRVILAHRRQTDDPHLNLALFLLHGIPTTRREQWMKENMPKTLAMLGFSALFHDMSHVDKRNRRVRKIG